jgi:hypothetical protein
MTSGPTDMSPARQVTTTSADLNSLALPSFYSLWQDMFRHVRQASVWDFSYFREGLKVRTDHRVFTV